MVYVNERQLKQVEYLLEQSSRGYHVLFDVDTIRRAFKRPLRESKIEPQNKNAAEKHLENLILQPTLVSKRAYLENLSPDTFEQVVRTYFSIVENNIFHTLKYTQ